MKKKLLVISYLLLVIFLILPSIWPLFRSDFFRMHDYTHAARLHQLDKALKDGHLPVRWSKDLGFGYGMPLFNFYAPLPYYIGEIFHLLGFSFVNCVKIIFALTFFISFIGMFLFTKKFWSKYGAFLSALAFTYSPYRAVDFYARGALGELWAIAFLPWATWSITQIVDKKSQPESKKYIPITAILISCVFLSHTVLALMALPFLAIFAIFYLLIKKNTKRKTLAFFTTFLLGLGLASFFLIPAFFEKDFTHVQDLISGYSHYSHHFLYFRQFLYGQWGWGGSVDGIEDGMSFHLGRVHLFLAFLTLGLTFGYVVFKKKVNKRALIVGYFTLLIVFLAFLSTYHAKIIWDAIPIMAFIQFPWRFNSLIIILIAFLAGGWLYYAKKITGKKTSLIFLIIVSALILKTNLRYFRPEKYVSPNDYYYTDEESIRKSMSSIIPDYIPVWVEKSEKPAEKEYKIISGDLQIKVLESKTHRLVLQAKADSSSKIQLNRFYFPGWLLTVNASKEKINYKDNNGIIYFSLPKGDFLLELKLGNTAVRSLANTISLACLFVSGFIFFINERRK